MTPKISCLTVTRDRSWFLKRAVEGFLNQTWPSKELVVVPDGRATNRSWVFEYVKSLRRKNIRAVMPKPGCSLGELRNYAVGAADGDVVCNWDDDNIYHPERLKTQYEGMREAEVSFSFIRDYFHLFEDTREIYIVRQDRARGAGTFMHEHSPLVKYDSIDRNEETALLKNILENKQVHYLEDRPYVYVRVYHGANAWGRAYHLPYGTAFGKDLPMEKLAELVSKLPDAVPERMELRLDDGSRLKVERGRLEV